MQLIPFDPSNREHINFLLKWNNDSEINYLFNMPSGDDGHIAVITEEHILKIRDKCETHLVKEEDYLGYVAHTVYDDPAGKVGWIAIVVGEKKARGRGLGVKLLDELENFLKIKKCVKAEIGVFEYNEPAIKLYTKCGYKEFHRIKDDVFWDGRKWDDIRMEKFLKGDLR